MPLAVTLAETVHDPFAGICAAAPKDTALLPAFAVSVPPKQVLAADAGLARTTPAGNASVSAADNTAVAVFGLVTVTVS